MKRSEIPACFFPTTVLFVDDDRVYLSSLQSKLQVEKFVPKFFYSGTETLQFLQKNYYPDLFAQRFLHRPVELELDHRSIDVNIPAIREEIYNPDRFSQISVVVVDYAMPDINGLDLCQRLKEKPFKKIMLTGEADEKIAVKAFNEGVIDKFIRKDAPQFNALINESISQLQLEYFQDLSSIVTDSLLDSKFSSTALNNPDFLKLFNQIVQENDITEYYLMDTYGSYMFLDFTGKPSWLVIKDEDGMQGAYEVAEGSDKPFPKEILQEMEKRKKILFIYEGGLSEDPEECVKSLHPAKKLAGKTPYYYALIKDPRAYDIKANKITSYKDYLEKVK